MPPPDYTIPVDESKFNPEITAAYESLRKKEQDAIKRATLVVTSAGVEMDPIRSQRLIEASRKTRLPTHFLSEGNTLEEAELAIKKGSFNLEQFTKDSPAFAAWMAKQPAHTGVSIDDLHELAKLEELTRQTPYLRQRSDGGFETLDEGGAITGLYRDPYAFKSKMSQERDAFEQQQAFGKQMRDIYGNGLMYQFATGALNTTTSTLGLLGAVDRQTAGIVGGIQAAAQEWDDSLLAEVTRGAGGLAGDAPLILLGGPLARAAKGLSTLATAGALRAAGAVSTRAWMGLARAGLAVSESKAGQYLGKAALAGVAVQPLALREGADVYAQGGSLGDAATAWAIETVIPASFGATGVEKFVLRGLSERAGKALYMSASHLLKHAGLEATEEVTTELAHAIHESMSGMNPDALEGNALTRRLLTAGILGAGAGGAFNLPAFFAGNMRKSKPERALSAMQLGNHLEQLSLAAKDSKTAGRVPHEVEQVLNQASQGAEGYLEPEAWTSFWQQQRKDPRLMAHEILGDAKVYDEALRTGAPMSMKLGTFAARLPDDARAHFANEIRAEPDAMNRREAQVEIDKLASTEAIDDPNEQVRKSNAEKRDAIQSNVEQQLIGAGTDPNAAALQAKQTANFFMATAKAAGLDPAELFGRYNVSINMDVPSVLASPSSLPDSMIAALKKAEPIPGLAPESDAELRAFVARHNVDLTKPNTEIRNALAVAAQTTQQNAVGKAGPDGTVSNDAAVIAEQSGGPGDGGRSNPSGATAPLEGAPIVRGATGPDPAIVAVARKYAADHGIEYGRQAEYAKVDPERAKRIASAYDAMVHDPQNPAVAEAYQNMIAQTLEQYRALEAAGYQFYFFDETNDPYDGNPMNAMRDLRENKRMGVFSTASGFGSQATDLDVSNNPLLAKTDVEWSYGSTEGPKKPVLANDVFRAVHDAFGHGIEGAGFRARGEENAWQAHARLYTGSAVGAMTSETRGQNSWLNYGPYGEANQTAKVQDTVFADQKTGLMPEWTWTEGIVPDQAPTVLSQGGLSIGSHNFSEARSTSSGGLAFNKPIALADGGRLSGFTDKTQRYFYGYEKNGDLYTHGVLSVDPNSIVGEDSFSQLVKGLLVNAQKENGQQLEQRKGSKRGQIALGKKDAAGNRTMAVTMFQAADLSTFLHESGHLYLEVLGDLAEDPKATDAIKKDYEKILTWLGVKSRADIKTVHHEQFARGYEAYLLEGKAPSNDLRAAFTRFRLWLLDLYKNVRNLNVPINDEIRGVFDRMLATEEEITDAAELLGARPLFTDAKSAGMTDAEFLKYRELTDAALADAKSELEQKALAEVTREKKEWWKEKRDAMRIEVELDVNRQKDQIAASVLKVGTYPGGVPLEPGKTAPKLSANEVNAWIKSKNFSPEEARTVKGKLIGMSSNAGIQLDASAELFGFPSGDALMQALVNRRNRNELIDALTDARMVAQYGNMMLDGSMAEEAKKIVNNDRRGDVLVNEARALGKKAGKRPAPSEVLREQANARIGRMKIVDLRPDVYRRAQAKAARNAFELTAQGKFAEALIEKQRELLNYHLARASQDAVDQVKSDRKYLQKFLDKGNRAAIGKAGGWQWTVYNVAREPIGTFGTEEEARQLAANTPNSTWEQTSSYLQRIDDILSSYELSGAGNKAALGLVSLRQWVDQQRALGAPVNIPDSVLDRSQKTHWRELTPDELGGVRDAVSNIAHLAKKKNELSKIQAQREFVEVRDEAIASIAANMTKGEPVPRSHAERGGPLDWLDSMTAAHRKLSSVMRQADGGKSGGIMWELFVRPLNEAADAEVAMRAEAAQVQKKLWDAWRATGKNIDDKRTIGMDVGTMSMNEIISVALNWGNQGNRDRLLRGEGWSKEQAEIVIAELDHDDMTLVQGILDHINSYWSEIKAKQQRVEGIAPQKVEALPIITRAGVFPGGYYPVQYDSRRAARSGNEAAAEAANLYALGSATRATTKRGHTEERSMQGTGKPLSLDIDVIHRHLSQVIHDLTHHETIIDMNKLLADDKMAQTIQDYMGQPTLREINDVVRSIAVSDLTENGIDRAMRHVRGGVSIATLGFSASTILMQVTGIGQSINRVGARAFARGVSRVFGDPRRQNSAWEFIKSKSSFMENRANTQFREANEVLNQVKGKAWRQNITHMAYWGMQRAQLMVDMPTWYAEYDNALESGVDEKTAIAQADQAVIDAQGSGLTKDLSGVQRSRWTQMFTVFYSYFNVTYNRTAESVYEYRQSDKGAAASLALAMDFIQLYTVPAMMAVAVKSMMDKDDDKEGWMTKLGKEHLSMGVGTMVGVRELSGALAGTYNYRGPAGAMGFAALSNVIAQAKQGEIDAALLKATSQAAGIWFHLPTLQAQRMIEGLMYYTGRRDANPAAILFGPPPKN